MKALDIVSTHESVTAVTPSRKGEAARRKRTFYARFGKRLMDLTLAVILLPLFFPLIAVTWLMTRLDGGPGFYSQQRVGLGGRSFKCWKIRTMVMNAEQVLQDICDKDPKIAEEWHSKQKLEKDPRITAIGGFLRATSLDELPQIWNVICGDMSFIGPRPFMTSQDPIYRAAGGTAYFAMRPGITGSWQVDGRGVTDFVDRIRYDEDYFETLSFREDMRLLFKTIQVVLQRTGH